jgi:uncharacterized protein YnzC (UPF0291/DUF896 family)
MNKIEMIKEYLRGNIDFAFERKEGTEDRESKDYWEAVRLTSKLTLDYIDILDEELNDDGTPKNPEDEGY